MSPMPDDIHPVQRYALPRIGTSVARVLPALAGFALLSACTLEPVQPWDRDLLAQPEMQLVTDPVENYLDEHTYFSKEAAFGGQGVGGGGCGCN